MRLSAFILARQIPHCMKKVIRLSNIFLFKIPLFIFLNKCLVQQIMRKSESPNQKKCTGRFMLWRFISVTIKSFVVVMFLSSVFTCVQT